MSTQSKNSPAAAISSKIQGTNLSVVPPKKNEPAKVIELSPLEKNLQTINELTELKKQHTRLVLSGQKLEEFRLKKGEENISLTLEDESHRETEFVTKNPEVITGIIACLRATIMEKRQNLEARLIEIKVAA